MTEPSHLVAADHLPMFITPPGETDVLFLASGIFLLLAVIGVGVLYFKLHALPEQMAHRGQKMQFEIVAVLCLLALFTHNHAFWVAGLLLALVPMPDFVTPLSSMSRSLERIAAREQQPDIPVATTVQAPEPPEPSETAQVAHDDRPVREQEA